MADPLTTAARKAREWTLERNRLIREASAAGESLRAIGARAGLSHAAVRKITRP